MGMNFLTDAARLKRIAEVLQQADHPAVPGILEAMNRLIRPASVLGVFAGIGLAFVDPPRYAAGIAALGTTPLPIGAFAGLIIGLHFLTKSGAEPVAKPPRT